jgi:hypothetical protein
MDKLPTEMKKCIWEFVGYDSLQTPTGKIMKDFIAMNNNLFTNYFNTELNNLYYDKGTSKKFHDYFSSEKYEWYFKKIDDKKSIDELWDEYINSNFVKIYFHHY